ncbi:threonine dehydrogenase and related Zn-dependent dehydrogenases [Pelotomaculum thermopropionicum SI]|uniref:Threonine dehydrogenase and related Zn-dependent dehydrogenases n=1 Tax=Pelotomaculum thermopropionicum (strain DSM 13744 / JCM 10971 / SI) TaxID=370438 RepID=A5D5N1_PELTS|nr:threonine dehydrogenase and related Zn-dependent dehydrogenases [Pelotomaculum thermopropionicum SI]
MRAIVKEERRPGAVNLRSVPEPRPAGDEVLIRVQSAAVCGSDLHAYEYPKSYEFMKVPVILGHEYSGYVEAVGPQVTLFKPGDRVLGESNRYCGVCPNCRRGRTNICDSNLMTGLHVDGGMAEFIAVPQKLVHHIPENLSFDEATLAQPCSVSFHAVFDNSGIRPNDMVAVFGPGIVGLMAAQGARLLGAAEVVVIGTGEDAQNRLPVAQKLGFKTINIGEQDLLAGFAGITGKERADVVLECSGAVKALADAFRLVKKGGSITLVGIYGSGAEINFAPLVRGEIQIKTSYTATWENYEQSLSLISRGLVQVRPLIDTYPFEEGVQAFVDALNKKVLKPVLKL